MLSMISLNAYNWYHFEPYCCFVVLAGSKVFLLTAVIPAVLLWCSRKSGKILDCASGPNSSPELTAVLSDNSQDVCFVVLIIGSSYQQHYPLLWTELMLSSRLSSGTLLWGSGAFERLSLHFESRCESLQHSEMSPVCLVVDFFLFGKLSLSQMVIK